MEEPTEPADSAGPISSTVRRWRRLAVRHNLQWNELLLIALNLYGLRGNDTEGMRLRINSENQEFMMVLPADRTTSPFSLRAQVDRSSPQHGLTELCVDGTPVVEIIEAEPGEEVRGYLRADGTAATVIFQEGTDSAELTKSYRDLLQALASDLADDGTAHQIKEVMLSAGQAHDEAVVVEHLVAVREAMSAEGLPQETTLGVLTSALHTQEAFAELAENVGPILLFLTTESFAEDSEGEAAQPEELAQVLSAARAAGHRTSFTYTVGADPLDEMRAWLLPLAEQTTVWPSLTILPAETPVDDSQHIAAPDERLDFFLEARSLLEQIFAPTELRPEPWRCYRGLWYREHAGEPLEGPYV